MAGNLFPRHKPRHEAREPIIAQADRPRQPSLLRWTAGRLSNELIRPDLAKARAVEEAAKALSKAIDAVTRTGSYSAEVLGNLPHDLVGLIGDCVAHKRERRWIALQAETDSRWMAS